MQDLPPRVLGVSQVNRIDLWRANRKWYETLKDLPKLYTIWSECRSRSVTQGNFSLKMKPSVKESWPCTVIYQLAHQQLYSPGWSVHCHHNRQICTYVHSGSSRTSQTWRAGLPLPCETLAYKESGVDQRRNSSKNVNLGVLASSIPVHASFHTFQPL